MAEFHHEEISCIDLTFKSDGFLLSGTLHLPKIPYPPLVMGSHGLLSSGNSPKQIEMAGRCSAAGMAYFRFDHRGCGQSQGTKADATDFKGRCRDLLHALDYLYSHFSLNSKIGLLGSSLGGAVCLSMFAQTGALALVTVAAPINSDSLIRAANGVIPEGLSADLALHPRFCFDLTDNLSSVHHLLIFHGDQDSVVPVSHAIQLYECADMPKKLMIQENGDHVMSFPDHQKMFMDESLKWYSSNLMNA
jgi:uncharacterized protein